MLYPVVRCPMCAEAVWTDRPKCEVCGAALGFVVPGTGVHAVVAPSRETSSTGRPAREETAPEVEALAEGSGRSSLGLPLLGRRKVLDRVHAHLHKAVTAGSSAAALLHGPAGSGKSALLAAAASAVGASLSVVRLEVRIPLGAREPLAPIERLVERWAGEGMTDRQDAGSLSRRLGRRLREMGTSLSAPEAGEIESRLTAQ